MLAQREALAGAEAALVAGAAAAAAAGVDGRPDVAAAIAAAAGPVLTGKTPGTTPPQQLLWMPISTTIYSWGDQLAFYTLLTRLPLTGFQRSRPQYILLPTDLSLVLPVLQLTR